MVCMIFDPITIILVLCTLASSPSLVCCGGLWRADGGMSMVGPGQERVQTVLGTGGVCVAQQSRMKVGVVMILVIMKVSVVH